jgi:hypothetical protein
MTDQIDTATESAPATSARRASRLPLIVGLLGALVLVVGVFVFVFGRAAASSASDDLGPANRQLSAQQASTKQVRGCRAAQRDALLAVVSDAQTYLGTVSQLYVGEDKLIAAFEAMQTAGAQAQPSAYSSALGQENLIAAANNALVNTARQQFSALQRDTSPRRTFGPCS